MVVKREGQQVDSLPTQLYGKYGNEIKGIACDQDGNLITSTFASVEALNKSYEGTLTAGISPLAIDFNNDAGRNSVDGWITCDGTGDITVRFSRDGATYGDSWTMKAGENANLKSFDIDTLELTHSGTDSAYRIVLI